MPAPSDVADHPALRRLVDFEQRHWFDPVPCMGDAGDREREPDAETDLIVERTPARPNRRDEPSRRRRPNRIPERRPKMGYQPSLDGLRAVAVLAVIAYHAGFGWMHGGWIGVEVFFVVSGYLITSLLIEERGGTGRISLKNFWIRRARRLLPALAMVLVTVSLVTAATGTIDQQSQLRRDLPWAVLYVSNWGQIAGSVPYYSTDPPLLRHLWSLAVEEQWYLLWPLAFVGLVATVARRRRIALTLAAAAVAIMVFTNVTYGDGASPIHSVFGFADGADRVNFLYLSTITRASGLLLGATAAFVWQPWRSIATATADAVGASPRDTTGTRRAIIAVRLDTVGFSALAILACVAVTARLTESYTYHWLLALVSIMAVVVVMASVHPAAARLRALLSNKALVAVGVRSYGLYLWHWPIFVLAKATTGSPARFAVAMAITAVLSELCFRLVETPVRRGALGRWWANSGDQRGVALAGTAALVLALGLFYSTVTPRDAAVGGDNVDFVSPSITTVAAPQDAPSATIPPPSATTVAAPAPAPSLPISMTIVGDSQAHAIAVNLPNGIDTTFDINDGSVEGCSVYDSGRVTSQRRGFSNNFGTCEGWADEWADAVSDNGSSLALVVLGAWDVFDLEIDGETFTFGTSAWDRNFLAQLQRGIDSLSQAGAEVALLEVACMRPVEAEGAAVPPLPERGDDERVAHVNELLRQAASDNAETTTFVSGPTEWCNDESVATDVGMRWDGVHPYKPGVQLIFASITDDLIDAGTVT